MFAGVAVQHGGEWIAPLILEFCKLSELLFVERVETSPWSLRLVAFHSPPGNKAVLVELKLSVVAIKPSKFIVV